MSVKAHQEGLDPVGSCVGQRGIRVQAVLAELGDEKIDIILHDAKTERYIANALSPARVNKIEIDKENERAKIYVPGDQLSLAIGKAGQNVRLAGKLVGINLDIERSSDEEGGEEHQNLQDKSLKKVEDKTDSKSKSKTKRTKK